MEKISNPGDVHRKTYGVVDLQVTITAEGGYTINTYAGPERVCELSSLGFMAYLDAAEVYRDIRAAGLARLPLADIAEIVRQRLGTIRAAYAGRPHQGERIALIDRAMSTVERLAATSDLSGYALDPADPKLRTFAELRAARATETPTRPRTFAELRAAHADAAAAYRAALAAARAS